MADNAEVTADVEKKPAEVDEEMKDAAPEQKTEPEKLKAPEKPKELEEDGADDSRAKLTAADATFLTEDTTLNVLATSAGKILTSLSDGGCQYLLAGARASAGVKAGRYMFEVKIIEKRTSSEPHSQAQGPTPKQLVRVGFSTSDSSLLLPDGGVCFDSEGKFQRDKEKIKAGRTFTQNQVVAVLLNLDPSSPNADTISLFCNGVRASEPQKLPESLKGKTLFPVVTYRNVTLQVNFGPQPLRALPFKARCLLDAAKADCETKVASAPAGGKYEVIFPVGMPDEGTFSWLDQFLEKNKNYTELSDRMIVNWAAKSGVQRTKPGLRPSHDKPDMESGLQLMDDMSVRRIMKALAPALERNFVVMEVKKNLLADERKKALASFPSHIFTRICQVRMGEPDEEFKAGVQDQILSRKKAKAEEEAKKKRADQTRKKAEELRKKKAEAAKKAREEAIKKSKEAKLKKAAGEEVEKEDAKDETMEDEKEDEPEEEIVAEEVSLTEEDKKVKFVKKGSPDVTHQELSSSFSKFSLPNNEEGFDRVDFQWQPEEKCKDYLRDWMLAKKLTEKVDDLQPSEWFKEKWNEWTKAFSAWKKKQQEFKDPAAKKKAAAAKKKAEEDKKKKDGEENKGGEGDEAPPEKEPDVKMDINVEDLDVFSVDDVTDCGNGEPLFAHYKNEDWAVLSLRYEIHLLVHAFRRDLNDPDRPSFNDKHLAFYYNKYYKKQFSIKEFGFTKNSELFELVKDTVEVSEKTTCLETQLADDTPMDNFVKLTEDDRRNRARRTEAGDETAALKYTRQQPQQPAGRHGQPGQPANRPDRQGSLNHGQKRPYSPGPSSYDAPSKYPRQPSAPPPRSGGGGDRGGGGGGTCRQFAAAGRCNFGDRCKFSHY